MTIKGTVHPRIPKHTYLLSAVYPFRSLGCELSNIGDISCRDVALLSDMMELGGSRAQSAKKKSILKTQHWTRDLCLFQRRM